MEFWQEFQNLKISTSLSNCSFHSTYPRCCCGSVKCNSTQELAYANAHPSFFLLPDSPCIYLHSSTRTLRTVHAIAILPRRQEERHAMMMRMRRVSLCRLLTRAARRISAAGIAATSIFPARNSRTQGALGSHVPTAGIQSSGQWRTRTRFSACGLSVSHQKSKTEGFGVVEWRYPFGLSSRWW